VTTLKDTDQLATDPQPDGHAGRPGALDAVTFRQLAIDQIDSVYRMAFHLARNADDASDLTQETYLRAFKAEAGFELRERGIRPWLFKILHNVFYTKIARAKRDPLFVETLEYDAADEGQTISTHSWDLEALDWEQLDERLKHAIEDLPAHYCQVLLLWAVECLRYREVADVLDIPIGTVMSRLYRARSILSEQLAQLAAEHGIKTEPAAKRTTKRSETATG
jgi:RNA polymerase sigma-70 factor (ECF subfamily)